MGLPELLRDIEVLEQIEAEVTAERDPVAFARIIGMEPDAWQATVLRSDCHRMLLNCSRQAGKSTISAIKALHGALYEPGSLTLLVSPSLRQSSELFRKVTDTLQLVPNAPGRLEDNKLSLTLANGSRIVSLPSSEATVRGFSAVRRIIEDEAAFVDDDLYTAIRPMLAVSGGQLILMSTPNGRRGHFFEAWDHGEGWEKIRIPATEVRRIAPDFLDDERRNLGDARFKQEYECEFVHAASGSVYRFSYDLNETDQAPPCDRTVLGIDYGYNDECAFTVIGWRTYDRTAYVLESFKRPNLTPSAAAEITRELIAKHSPDKVVGDTGGLGKGYAEEARSRFALPIMPANKTNKRGYIDLMNDALRSGKLKAVKATTRALIDEWLSLPWDEKREKEASGFANHCADSALYSWRECAAWLEDAEPIIHKTGTKEANDAEAERLFEERMAEISEQRNREWWE